MFRQQMFFIHYKLLWWICGEKEFFAIEAKQKLGGACLGQKN